MTTIIDYGSSKCFSGFFSPQWRLYMSTQCFTEGAVATTSLVKVPEVLRHGELFSLTAWNPQGVVISHAENGRLLERLRSDINSAEMDCCVYESFACARGDDDDQNPTEMAAQWYEAGLTVHCQNDEGQHLPVIVGLAKQYNQLSIFQYKYDSAIECFVQTQIPVDDHAAQVVPAPVHAVPISLQTDSSLYPSFSSAAIALKVHAARTGMALEEIGDEILEIEKLLLVSSALEGGGFRYPVIVIEGIDGCGKTTLCASLVERLGPGASLFQTPSSRMSRLRHVFDACDESVRRAYYSLCNYSVARDLLQSAALGPVVLDRYWHSTVAYALAHTQSRGLANPSTIAEWPRDLLRPSAVLLLTVGEEERQQRMGMRGVHTTQEESEIKNKAGMRQRLMEAYRALRPTAEIDGNGTASEVLEAVWSKLRNWLVVGPQTNNTSSIIPLSVNYHLTRMCNYHCKFCFHTTKSSSHLSLPEAKRGLRELQKHGMKKINFSGGEPFTIDNGDFLGELCVYCKKNLKIESVSVICNGSLVTEQWFDKYAHYIDVFGLSIDSFKENTLIDIGRYGAEGLEDHIDKVYAIRGWCAKYGLKFKINTVVTKQILIEDMAPHMRELRPDRWKVFQCLLIDGENVGENALRDASPCVVTAVEFRDWVQRHSELSPVVESNELMMNSYLILDEKMRFLNCTKGRKDPSVSILDGGVLKALVEAGHDQQTFYRRGGSYEWSKTFSVSVPEHL